jgi:hypothetical protein
MNRNSEYAYRTYWWRAQRARFRDKPEGRVYLLSYIEPSQIQMASGYRAGVPSKE